MEAIFVEIAVSSIHSYIYDEYMHIIDVGRKLGMENMINILKPHHELTKFVITDGLELLETNVSKWMSCIDEHSVITIPSGIHANVKQIHELVMDVVHKTCGYRMIIQHMCTHDMDMAMIDLQTMFECLKQRLPAQGVYDEIYCTLDSMQIHNIDMYGIINRLQSCMAMAAVDDDIRKDIEFIYRCVLNANVIQGLHDELTSTVFAHERVQRMITTYGVDWLDEM